MQPLPGSSQVASNTPVNIYQKASKNLGVDAFRMDATFSIDGANTGRTSSIRPGTPIGIITATGLAVPCKRTQANGASDTAGVSLTVDNAQHFKVGDTIKVASQSDTTITAINYTTNVITLAASRTWSDNAAVKGSGTPLAGSETAIGILAETVELYDDDARDTVDRYCAVETSGGHYNRSAILGDVTAILANTNLLGGCRFYTNGVQVTA